MQPVDRNTSAVTEDLERGTRPWGEPESRCPRILVISRDAAQRRFLHGLCAASDWHARDARDWREGVLVLSRCGIDVILCDDLLPDGAWKDVLSVVAPMPASPRVIVLFDDASASEWSEVLNLGGFDVLNKPLDEAGVNAAVAAAWRNVQDEAQERRKRYRRTSVVSG